MHVVSVNLKYINIYIKLCHVVPAIFDFQLTQKSGTLSKELP